jgi:hypothetical protein
MLAVKWGDIGKNKPITADRRVKPQRLQHTAGAGFDMVTISKNRGVMYASCDAMETAG